MKKKGGLITMAVAVLIVALLFAAYQWFRFPEAFRNLSDWRMAYGTGSGFW